MANATGNGTVKATAQDTKGYMAAAKYVVDALTLRAGYEREEYTNPSDPTVDVAITSLYGVPLAAPASVTAYPQQKNLDVYWGGGGYEFTPNFTLLAGLYHVTQNNYDPAGCANRSQLARCSGALNYYSLVGDFPLSKRSDVYAGMMKSTVSGGPAAAVANTPPATSVTQNRILALGFRHRF